MKNTKGFTLVELIVVIAILAILAGIAIPVYSGYITKAKEAADYQTLDAIKTAAVFAATDANTPNAPTVKKITVTAGDTGAKSVAIEYKETAPTGVTYVESVDVSAYMGSEAITFKSGKTSAVWEDGAWKLN